MNGDLFQRPLVPQEALITVWNSALIDCNEPCVQNNPEEVLSQQPRGNGTMIDLGQQRNKGHIDGILLGPTFSFSSRREQEVVTPF